MTEVRTALVTTGRVSTARPATGEVAIPGRPGRDGLNGSAFGFGQIRFGETAGSAPLIISAGTRSPLTFVVDPAQTQDLLNPPFAGHLGFDGTTIASRAYGDAMFVLVNLLVTSLVSGGSVKIDIDVGSPLGPTGSDTEGLFNSAGAPERVTAILFVQTLSYFMTNGAKLFITSTVPISIVSETVLLIPQSTRPT